MRSNAIRLASVVLWCAACGGKHGTGTETDGLVSIEVLPANATITYTGAPATLDYNAVGHYDDGHTAPLPDVAFSLDSSGPIVGSFAAATFTANGTTAGKGKVLAALGSASGSTAVIVSIHETTFGSGVDPGAGSDFPDPITAGALSPVIDYPLDGAVMPSSVRAPDVQWEPGASAAGDLFRVRWVSGLATLDSIVAAPAGFTYDLKPSDADWATLTASAAGDPITVEVDHWDATNGAAAGTPVQVHVIPGDVVGAIYYWDLSQGRMQRIDVNGRALAIPNPPEDPATPGDHCVACHTVSRDGRYLAASLFGGGEQGGVFDLTDPNVVGSGSSGTAPTLAPVTAGSYRTLFNTFNPDGTRLVINNGLSLDLIDPHTGLSVPQAGTPLPTANMAHPSWSPDGTAIAVVGNVSYNGGAAPWAVDYTAGDLQIIPVTGPDTFGPPSTLVAQGSVDPAFAAPSWPSFSPDSSVIAYAAGVNSRGRNTVGGTEVTYPGALFYVPKAGGAPVRLDAACSSGRNCFLPNFSPFDQGGYYWMVFYSLRDYGNALAGTKGTTRRQMWITAIDKTKLAAGLDASSVPYWLPEQDVATENMSAFWSVAPPIQ